MLTRTQVEYAVRGEIVGRAQRIAEDLEKGNGDKYAFEKVITNLLTEPDY